MGRRKIEITMVTDTNTRQVTFSKRRTGLFKKANELSILCGAEVAIVVFSPGNKPYSFGHPGVDAVAAKFLEPESKSIQNVTVSKLANIDRLNQKLGELMEQLHADEKKGEVHDEIINQQFGTQLSQLQKSYEELLKLRVSVKSRLCDLEAAETLIHFSHTPVESVKSVPRKKRKN